MAAKREPGSHMPQCGLIDRGVLKGWRFAFIRFVCEGGDLYLDLRCTPPDWPFPQTVRFDMSRDKFGLRAVTGERAPRHDAVALMAQAMQYGAAYSPVKE